MTERKQKRKKLRNLKRNLNIATLEVGIRKYEGPGCSYCQCRYADIIERPRLSRKRNTYLSR